MRRLVDDGKSVTETARNPRHPFNRMAVNVRLATIGWMGDRLNGMHAPLYLLAGAPGAGKTTLLPHLLQAADGLVVMDMDELLEHGELIGVPIAEPEAAPIWPAYDRMWGRIVTMVRRAGHPMLLMCPIPDASEVPAFVRWDGPVRWALLDCPDDERQRRLRERGAPRDWMDDALADAAQGRELITTVFHAVGTDHAGLAAQVLAWAHNPHAVRLRPLQSRHPVEPGVEGEGRRVELGVADKGRPAEGEHLSD